MPPDPQMRWLRLWTDILEDPKLLLLAPDDRWYFVAILAIKRAGILDEGDAPELLDRKVSLKLRIDHRERDELRNRLMAVRLIGQDWQPVGWEKRQFASDADRTAAERQRRHRNSIRHGRVTRDRGVTSRTSHGRVTTPETEQSQRKSREESPLPPSGGPICEGLNLPAWSRWEGYRREIRKPIKPASLLAAQRKLAGFGADQTAVVEQSIANGWQGLFELKRSSSTGSVDTGWRPPKGDPRYDPEMLR